MSEPRKGVRVDLGNRAFTYPEATDFEMDGTTGALAVAEGETTVGLHAPGARVSAEYANASRMS